MPESNLDLSQAPSAQEQPEQSKGPACHRSFQFILDPTAAMAGLSHTANILTVSFPCLGEKCALWNADNEKCGDLVQAVALDVIACHFGSKGT